MDLKDKAVNWLDTIVVTVEGILIVFAVLVIIMLVLYALKLFAKEEPVKSSAVKPATSKAPTIYTVSDKDAESLEESELIAIFSGAIAGYMDVPVEGISIASYKKIN